MNNVLQSLLSEHDHMRKMLNIFDQQLAIFEKAEQPDYEVLSESLAYCKDYLDVWHHPREDRLLELLQQRDPAKAAPLFELEEQHIGLARDTSRVVQVFRDVAERGSVQLREDLVRSGRQLSGAYRQHIQWEEAHFFPVIERSLGADDWEIASREMAQAPHASDRKALGSRYPALFEAIGAAS